jgi:hypothetical protein
METGVFDLETELARAVARACRQITMFGGENDLQVALVESLGDSERELVAAFDPPKHLPRRPPPSAIEDLSRRSPSRRVPQEGRDPCARAARVDILWNTPVGKVPIELKFCARRKADVYGYQFLKDLHRLERLIAAGGYSSISADRFAVFVTREPVYWEGRRPEPEPFWLTHGRRIGPRYWVQYDQQSADTLWYSYPPFYIAGAYQFGWLDLAPEWRYLLVRVRHQDQSS